MPVKTLRIPLNPQVRRRRGAKVRPFTKRDGTTGYHYAGRFISAEDARRLGGGRSTRRKKAATRRKPAKRKASRRKAPAKRKAPVRRTLAVTPKKTKARSSRARHNPPRRPKRSQTSLFGDDTMKKGKKLSPATRRKTSLALKRFHRTKTTAKARKVKRRRPVKTFAKRGKKYAVVPKKRKNRRRPPAYTVVRMNSPLDTVLRSLRDGGMIYGSMLIGRVGINAFSKHVLGKPGVSGLLKSQSSSGWVPKVVPFVPAAMALGGMVAAPKLFRSQVTAGKVQLGLAMLFFDNVVSGIANYLPTTVSSYLSLSGDGDLGRYPAEALPQYDPMAGYNPPMPQDTATEADIFSSTPGADNPFGGSKSNWALS